MTIASDVHMHTRYCDGADTPEQMIRSALQKGFTTVGICTHAPLPEPMHWTLDKTRAAAYFGELSALRAQYAGKIEVLIGVEQDYFSIRLPIDLDYTIGSVHFIEAGGNYICIDDSAQTSLACVNQHFGGDYLAFIEAYYALVSNVVEQTGADIIGHFDIISKFNEGYACFDERDPRYVFAALEAVSSLVKTGRPFEVNTGAISRGYRTQPYPAPFVLKEIRRQGGEILFSSDSHSAAHIGYLFPEAIEYAKACGFRYAKVLTGSGFQDVCL